MPPVSYIEANVPILVLDQLSKACDDSQGKEIKASDLAMKMKW